MLGGMLAGTSSLNFLAARHACPLPLNACPRSLFPAFLQVKAQSEEVAAAWAQLQGERDALAAGRDTLQNAKSEVQAQQRCAQA